MRYQQPATSIEVGNIYQAIDVRRVILRIIGVKDKPWYDTIIIDPGKTGEDIGSCVRWFMYPENWSEIIQMEDIYDTLEYILLESKKNA